jgi:ABC-type transporter Mla subunit MlaD
MADQEIGTLVARFKADMAEFIGPIREAMGEVREFSKEALDATKRIGDSLKNLEAKEAADSFRQISDAVSGFASEFRDAAAAADDLADGLKGAFGDNADSVANFIQQVGTAKGVLTDGALAQAAQTLQNLGAFSEESLQRVADAAVATGKPVESLAEAFGRFEKFGDSKSILGLQKAIGAAGPELEKFGAFLARRGGPEGTGGLLGGQVRRRPGPRERRFRQAHRRAAAPQAGGW